MRDAENIREVEALGIDMMGFIFYPKSSRYVSVRPPYLPTKCKRVGVFVDEDIEKIKKIADDYALDFIQLHGHESIEEVKKLQDRKVIKAFNIATKEDLDATAPYEGLVDYFLFDTKGQSAGGNGEKFDWSILKAYNGDTPFLLSGGIGPDDAETLNSQLSARLCRLARPRTLNSHCIGIDLNSRFEVEPGIKDIIKLKTFLNYGK